MFAIGSIVRVRNQGFAVVMSVTRLGIWVRFEEDRTNSEYLIAVNQIEN